MERQDSYPAADARTAAVCALSPGNAQTAPEGRALLEDLDPMPGMIPVAPPKSDRLDSWECDGRTTANFTRGATR